MLATVSSILIFIVIIWSIFIKDTEFVLSQDLNELKIINTSLWQKKQETYAISDIKQVRLDNLDSSQSKSGMYKLALLLNSGKAKKIVVVDSSRVKATELLAQIREFISHN